jgi:hypothetical protein
MDAVNFRMLIIGYSIVELGSESVKHNGSTYLTERGGWRPEMYKTGRRLR